MKRGETGYAGKSINDCFTPDNACTLAGIEMVDVELTEWTEGRQRR